MTNSIGHGGVPTGSSIVAGSSHGGGSRGCEGRREGDNPYDAPGSRDKDISGHGKGTPVELLNYKVPAALDAMTTTSDSDTDSGKTEHPDSGVLPFFEIELVNTHVVKRYRLLMPSKAMRLLPNEDVAVTLRHGDNQWAGTYQGSTSEEGEDLNPHHNIKNPRRRLFEPSIPLEFQPTNKRDARKPQLHGVYRPRGAR